MEPQRPIQDGTSEILGLRQSLTLNPNFPLAHRTIVVLEIYKSFVITGSFYIFLHSTKTVQNILDIQLKQVDGITTKVTWVFVLLNLK